MSRNLIAGLAAVILLTACSTSPNRSATPPAPTGSTDRNTVKDGQASKVDYAAPDFTVQTFEGADFTLTEHQGTPVVLNFWESW